MAKLQKSIDKKNALIDATIHLVNTNGFHAAPMSKIAKMANVSPATIYLYFNNKQDLVNQTYIEVKKKYTQYVFDQYNSAMAVEDAFKHIWFRISDFKLKEDKYGMFLAQCDYTPMIDENCRQEGIKHLQPLLSLWDRGKQEGIIKSYSDYVLYAYAINPLSFLMIAKKRHAITLDRAELEQAYQAAWQSIKV